MAAVITMGIEAGVTTVEEGAIGVVTLTRDAVLGVVSARVYILASFECGVCPFRLRKKIFLSSSRSTILLKTVSYLHTGVMDVLLGKVT